MPSSRPIVIAGAGIGGLTAALALARRGLRAIVLEQAERLEETGAGVQLSPNATRILIALGLEQSLRRNACSPQSIAIQAADGHELTTVPLGQSIERRYGAPYWSIHRGDLQSALIEAVRADPNIDLRVGAKVEDFASNSEGIRVTCRRGSDRAHEHGAALICADGVWSALRGRLGHRQQPQFRQRTAWRALVPATAVDARFRAAQVQLWLGRDAHLVHYPVKAGALINVVAIVHDRWAQVGWTAEGDRDELLTKYSNRIWCTPVREFLALPERWQKWALYDLPPLSRWSEGPVTLLGDAAHPMLPFLAQGAATAIEDAAVVAQCIAEDPSDIAAALGRYECARIPRTGRIQRAARSNGHVYHLAGAPALLRNLTLRLAGGDLLLRRYDWLYDWQLPSFSGVQ